VFYFSLFFGFDSFLVFEKAMDDKAKTTLDEAEIIRGQGCCANSAANRYYFAVLQSIVGFADRTEGYSRPTGKGGNHKWASGIAQPYLQSRGKELWRAFHILQGLRVKADYEPTNVVSDDLNDEFIETITKVFSVFSIKTSEES
jgi:hypothetical protein